MIFRDDASSDYAYHAYYCEAATGFVLPLFVIREVSFDYFLFALFHCFTAETWMVVGYFFHVFSFFC